MRFTTPRHHRGCPPVANPDTGSAGENETKSFDVVANDTEVDTGDTKTLDTTLGAILVTSANGQINGIDATSAFSVRLANGAFSLLWLNPPYDADDEKRRLEHAFLTGLWEG